ncbi:MAG: DUF1501 domain-containing protein, partial [Planctomycetes bacterium]|nr:DUF1501 domain-containing protein [Planctomycetota bacterium]
MKTPPQDVPDLLFDALQERTRRQLLCEGGLGLGGLFLGSLLGDRPAGALLGDDPMAARTPHHPGRAKRVIYLHM